MERLDYPNLKETVYYEELSNGLKVYIMPKYGFSKTYATFTTNFGSIDTRINDEVIPEGVAHFLEHQLFNTESGDITDQFAAFGANVNAFTTYDKTSYLFSCTSNVEENLELLIDFVQDPYFTVESVEKERGIIEEELQMYNDNPDVKLVLQGMKNLFKTHPMKDDIGGTIESIKDITKSTLDKCHNYFYNPSNMMLFVVGNINPEPIMALIKENQNKKNFDSYGTYVRNIPYEVEINEKESLLIEPDVFEKATVAYKNSPEIYEGNYEKYRLSMMIYLDILFGRSSYNYERLFEEKLINYTFGSISYIEPQYAVIQIGGDTANPDLLVAELKNMINSDLDYNQFVHMKNKFYGSMLKLLNYPEGVANEFTSFKLAGSDLFNVINIMEGITFDDVKKCREFFTNEVVVKMKHTDKDA